MYYLVIHIILAWCPDFTLRTVMQYFTPKWCMYNQITVFILIEAQYLMHVKAPPATKIPPLLLDKIYIKCLIKHQRSSRNSKIWVIFQSFWLPCEKRSMWFLLAYIRVYTTVFYQWMTVFIIEFFKCTAKPACTRTCLVLLLEWTWYTILHVYTVGPL